MTVTSRPGLVRSAAHRHNLLHPDFPRVRSTAERAVTLLHRAGYQITIADLIVAAYEPAGQIDALTAAFPPADTGSFGGPPPRRRRARRPTRERARQLHTQAPKHYARARVRVTAPDGAEIEFTLEQGSYPGRWDRIARNRLVPVDILDLVLHTLTSWAEDLELSDPRGAFGRGVLTALTA